MYTVVTRDKEGDVKSYGPFTSRKKAQEFIDKTFDERDRELRQEWKKVGGVIIEYQSAVISYNNADGEPENDEWWYLTKVISAEAEELEKVRAEMQANKAAYKRRFSKK